MSTEQHIKQAIKLALKIKNVNNQRSNADLENFITFCLKNKIKRIEYFTLFYRIHDAISNDLSIDENFKAIMYTAVSFPVGRKLHRDIVNSTYLALFQLCPFHHELQMEIRKLLPKMDLPGNFSEKEIYELGSEIVQIQLDSFIQTNDSYHFDLVECLLNKQNPPIKISAEKNRLSQKGLMVKNQVRNNDGFLDKSDHPIYLECFTSEEAKIIISVIDFDSPRYLNKALYCKNLLIALNNFSAGNPEYRTCMIITGKIEKELVEWIQTSVELWRCNSLKIENVEVLYALPYSQVNNKTKIFFYPLRAVLHTGLRVRCERKSIEFAWRYIDFMSLLNNTIKQSNEIKNVRFMSLLSNNFLKEIKCIRSPKRDNIEITNSVDSLLTLAREKFEPYIVYLIKNHPKDLKKILDRTSIDLEKEDDLMQFIKNDINEKEIIHHCFLEFEKCQSLLRKNLEQVKLSVVAKNPYALDWGHILHDVLVKKINYSSGMEHNKNTVFPIDKLPEKLHIYSEIIPFYFIKTYILVLFKESKAMLHIRGFGNEKHFDYKTTEAKRISNRETFWHVQLENALINILFLVMRKAIEEKKVTDLADQIFNVLSKNIDIKKHFQPIEKFISNFREEYLSDFITHPHFKILFNEKNAKIFLDKFQNSLQDKLKKEPREKRDLSEDEKKADKAKKAEDNKNKVDLKEQYDGAYNELLETSLHSMDFTLLDLYKVIEGLNVDNVLSDTLDVDNVDIEQKLGISHASYLRIIALLQSLKFHISHYGHVELNSQINNLYIKKAYGCERSLCKFIYVIVDDVITLAPESLLCPDRSEGQFEKGGKKYWYKRPTHSCLAKGRSVQAAGECIFSLENNVWSLIYITNGSGHYRPDAFTTLSLAEKFFKEALKNLGFNINIEKLILRNTITPNITFNASDFLPSYGDLPLNNAEIKSIDEIIPLSLNPDLSAESTNESSSFSYRNNTQTLFQQENSCLAEMATTHYSVTPDHT